VREIDAIGRNLRRDSSCTQGLREKMVERLWLPSMESTSKCSVMLSVLCVCSELWKC